MCARQSSAARRPAGYTAKYMRDDVLRLAHKGHQGIVKTKNRLRAKVLWP